MQRERTLLLEAKAEKLDAKALADATAQKLSAAEANAQQRQAEAA